MSAKRELVLKAFKGEAVDRASWMASFSYNRRRMYGKDFPIRNY